MRCFSSHSPPLRDGCSGTASVWGKEGILPPASVSSSLVVIESLKCFTAFSFPLEFSASVVRAFGVRPRTTPFHVSISEYVVSLSLLDVSAFGERRPSPLRHGRPSGNARGRRARPHVLAPEARVSTRRASSHPMRAQTPAVRHPRGTAGAPLPERLTNFANGSNARQMSRLRPSVSR